MTENNPQNSVPQATSVSQPPAAPIQAPVNPAESALKSTTPPASILQEHEPEKESAVEKVKNFLSNKGLIFGVILVVIAVVVGFSVMFGFNATDQYQGLIQQIEKDTQEINAN